ncbi:hypothetical protein PCE1_003788 [Barthelona sp. PCE]
MSNIALQSQAVLVESDPMPKYSVEIKGYSWEGAENGFVDYEKMLDSYITTGFQAQHLGQAMVEVNRMLECRKQPMDQEKLAEMDISPDHRCYPRTNCTIFMGYTSNLISSGLRETLCFLVKHNLVDCVVATAGGVEEDIIKCLAPTYSASFALDGVTLRSKGHNRIGNMIVPNENYCKFQDWLEPIMDEMLEKQKNEGVWWTPSKMIKLMGERIDDESSVLYWCAKNNIPIFSPAITDGSLGDNLYFNSYNHPELRMDIIDDIRYINDISAFSLNTGMLILGGGLIKHHICNANLMRDGADFSVYINTSGEYDGSDAGAKPDEAKSWGKIRQTARPVKVTAEVTLVLPLLVARTFVPYLAEMTRLKELE